MGLKYYGWYDGSPKSQGNVVLSYWNHVVNEFPLAGNDQNDLERYTKEHYVKSCKLYMDKHSEVNANKKFIIDLPISEVYSNGARIAEDGFEENIPIWKTLDWIEYVVNELDSDDRVLGWYHADEPEVWGYREVVNGNVTNSNPKIPYEFLRERYWYIKGYSQKPILAVFCDTKLFIDNYYNQIIENGPFFDVFGFDHYPFTLNKSLDLAYIKSKLKQFVNIANNIREYMPILYVGQGSGSPEFNTRSPQLAEHEMLFKAFIESCPEENRFGYLLWSYTYADDLARVKGDIVLLPENIENWESSAFTDLKKVSNIKKIFLNLIEKLLYLFRLRNNR